MRQINPYMAAAHRSGDPDANAAKKAKFLANKGDCIDKPTKYRLYLGDVPVGLILICIPMDVHAWNKNARAFYAYQCTLGRDRLPMLEYREEKDESGTKMMRVFYRQNGREQHRDFVADSKAEAKRQFDLIASVACIIMKVEPIADALAVANPVDGGQPEQP
jgi:hypothetical protein